ncbi:MAG: hypothetical protein QM784_25205 [Polyangiaceae bacterium]
MWIPLAIAPSFAMRIAAAGYFDTRHCRKEPEKLGQHPWTRRLSDGDAASSRRALRV